MTVNNPILYLTVGNVGCGKTPLSMQLMYNGVVRNSRHEILKSMHGGEPANYIDDMKIIYRQIDEDIISGSLVRDLDVVVDHTNISKASRRWLMERAAFVSEMRLQKKQTPVKVVCFDFGPGSVEDLNRRLASPKGLSSNDVAKVFSDLSQSYEAPDLSEGINHIFKIHNRNFPLFDLDFSEIDRKIVQASAAR